MTANVMKLKSKSKKVSIKVAIANAKAIEQANLRNEKYIICPSCLQFVYEKNLERHESKSLICKEMLAHERQIENQRRASKAKIEERKKLGESRRNIVQNPQIYQFLRENPIKDEIRKFGVPQDKYRYGFYGSSTMEYDIWRNGSK